MVSRPQSVSTMPPSAQSAESLGGRNWAATDWRFGQKQRFRLRTFSRGPCPVDSGSRAGQAPRLNHNAAPQRFDAPNFPLDT